MLRNVWHVKKVICKQFNCKHLLNVSSLDIIQSSLTTPAQVYYEIPLVRNLYFTFLYQRVVTLFLNSIKQI